MASVVTETKGVEESTPPYRRDETRHLHGTRHQGSNASSRRPYRAVATRHISSEDALDPITEQMSRAKVSLRRNTTRLLSPSAERELVRSAQAKYGAQSERAVDALIKAFRPFSARGLQSLSARASTRQISSKRRGSASRARSNDTT